MRHTCKNRAPPPETPPAPRIAGGVDRGRALVWGTAKEFRCATSSLENAQDHAARHIDRRRSPRRRLTSLARGR